MFPMIFLMGCGSEDHESQDILASNSAEGQANGEGGIDQGLSSEQLDFPLCEEVVKNREKVQEGTICHTEVDGIKFNWKLIRKSERGCGEEKLMPCEEWMDMETGIIWKDLEKKTDGTFWQMNQSSKFMKSDITPEEDRWKDDDPRLGAVEYCKSIGASAPTGWWEEFNGYFLFPDQDSEIVAAVKHGMAQVLPNLIDSPFEGIAWGHYFWSRTIDPRRGDTRMWSGFQFNGDFLIPEISWEEIEAKSKGEEWNVEDVFDEQSPICGGYVKYTSEVRCVVYSSKE